MLARTPDGIGIEFVEEIHALGFDYVELPLAQMAALSQADFQALERAVAQSGIRCEACNNFFPSALKLTGPDADLSAIMSYAIPAMERAARLGAKVVAFGSGPAKLVPAGFPRSSAWRQLVELLKKISLPARRLGLNVAIEPLRRQECDIVNTAAEGLSLVQAVDSEEVKLLVDFFHLDAENESCQIISAAGGQLCHIHIARPEGRRFPSADDAPLFQAFFASLGAVLYDQRISIEAYSKDFRNDARSGLSFLQGAFPR